MLELRHVSVRSGLSEGLSDISLTVEKGEAVAVIGPNGSGKSLLCRVIADPDIRQSGELIVNHFHAKNDREKVKLQIGYASDGSEGEPYLTGYEYLELVGSFYHLAASVRQARILELAQTFRCLDELYTLGERQSAATNQKINLIASLLASPPLLVWDQPTRFLDEFGKTAAINELEKALKNGAGALIATNDLKFAEDVADRIVLLSHGQLLTEGTTEQLAHLAGTHKKSLASAFGHLLGDA